MAVSREPRSVWHTDIVVGRQGFNLKLKPSKGRIQVTVSPDTPGDKATRAIRKFGRAMAFTDSFPSVPFAKMVVEQAVASTHAEWNGWHREAYE